MGTGDKAVVGPLHVDPSCASMAVLCRNAVKWLVVIHWTLYSGTRSREIRVQVSRTRRITEWTGVKVAN